MRILALLRLNLCVLDLINLRLSRMLVAAAIATAAVPSQHHVSAQLSLPSKLLTHIHINTFVGVLRGRLCRVQWIW